MNTFIYALVDPISKKIRYIGKSNEPKKRYYQHLYRSERKRTHKECWINKLLREGLKPELIIIEECSDNWQEREKFYIAQYDNLTNSTSGGDGTENYKHTPDSILKMSEQRQGKNNAFYGKHHSDETKTIISQKNKLFDRHGEKHPLYGKGHSEKTKEILSKKAKENWKKGIGNLPPVLIGSNNPASKKRILISPDGTIYTIYNIKKFCDEMNLSYSTLMNNINKGKIPMPTEKLILSRQRKKSKNTIGWKIIQP
jgi:group I intron endonuclease